jgi:hypothetical protein
MEEDDDDDDDDICVSFNSLTAAFTPKPLPLKVQRDSKRWTQFRTSIFPELYTVCE